MGSTWIVKASIFLNKTVFDNDLIQKKSGAIKQEINRVHHQLVEQSEQYFEQLKQKINIYQLSNQPKVEILEQLTQARISKNDYQNRLSLINSIQNCINTLQEKIINLELEFEQV